MVYGGESHNITTSWGFFFPAIHSNWAILEQLTKGNEINEMKFCRFLWVLRVPILKLKPLNLRTWGLSLFLSFSLSFSLSLHPHQSLPTCIENYYNAILKVHNEIFAHASDYGTPNGSETWLQEMEILESQELRQYRFRTSFTPKQGQNFPPEVWSCPSLSHLLMFCHLRWLSHPSENMLINWVHHSIGRVFFPCQVRVSRFQSATAGRKLFFSPAPDADHTWAPTHAKENAKHNARMSE